MEIKKARAKQRLKQDKSIVALSKKKFKTMQTVTKPSL